ncbi:MAG: chromosome condensation regulator RCC1 [Gemmatimonadetes bacterium]|nr:carboxypeptidase regulatory-like domain-containing protein [Gemmatimonadota bacterium]NNM05602.1 chromosome condensation regulator RCC1 [Gemmatimonadota bacterium]
MSAAGNPQSGVAVSLTGAESGSATTGATGSYQIGSLAAGAYTVTISNFDSITYFWRVTSLEVSLSAGGTVVVDFDGETPTSWRSVAVGASHSCALTQSDSEAYCWGRNDHGQLGTGAMDNTDVPMPVSSNLTFQNLQAGVTHSCGVTATGSAHCWGANDFGQLGDGTSQSSNVPVAVAGALAFKGVTAGEGFTCGVTQDDHTYCWGRNDRGQLGNGTGEDSNVPVRIAQDPTLRRLISSLTHTCAPTLTGDGRYCWGANESGQLGDGTTQDRNVPVAVQALGSTGWIKPGGSHSCADIEGVLLCWGQNDAGQLGDGTEQASPVPVAVVSNPNGWVAPGWRHTCSLVEGELFCWGDNAWGQLGNGTTEPSNVPVAASTALRFRWLSSGKGSHTCAISTDTEMLFCWGGNVFGQLGTGGTEGSAIPVRVVNP